MTGQQILQSDLLDILFEKRNKLYGAYDLRKSYHQRLLKGVVMALALVFLLIFLFKPDLNQTKAVVAEGGVVLRTVELPRDPLPKPEAPKPPKAQAPQVRQENFIDQILMKQEVTKPLPPQDILKFAAVSNTTTAGDEVGNLQPKLPEEIRSNGQGAATPASEPAKEMAPDRQPQYPGGLQAWVAFLNNNLHAPEDLQSGERKTAQIRFHVAEDGSITNFVVVQSAGHAFDSEVIRVLRKMPKWTPAMQGGKPVAVSFTQPVTFVAVDE